VKDPSIPSEPPPDGLASKGNSIDSNETKEGSSWDELMYDTDLDADDSSDVKMQGIGADGEDLIELD
jgi:hypothetical protein